MTQLEHQICSRRRSGRTWYDVLTACVLVAFITVIVRPVTTDEPNLESALELDGKGEVGYKIEVPVNDDGTGPASPVTAVTVYPGGVNTENVQPVVTGPSGKRRAAEFLWARKNEPIRVVFDTSHSFQSDQNYSGHAVYYLSLRRTGKVDDGPKWNRRHGLTLETKNFGKSYSNKFDSSLKQFIYLWNESPEMDGRSLVNKVQHGYPLHQPYGKTPLEYMPNRGAPLSLNRYRGYFRVDKPDRSKIDDLRAQAKKNRKEVNKLEKKLKELEANVKEAEKALKKARKNGDKNEVENRKTALNEWKHRRAKVKKRELPKARRKYEFADAAISEIKNNTYTFLTGSDGVSWVLVDGKKISKWPANEQLPKKGDKYYGYKEGSINLDPGVHRVEYLYAATGKSYLTFMLWRHPAERKPKIMQPEMFGNVAEARVVDALTGSGKRPPGWEILQDSRIPGVPDFLIVRFQVPGVGKKSKDDEGPVYRWQFGDGATAEGRNLKHMYLESGQYDVTLEKYENPSAEEPLWSVRQPVRVHVPYDLGQYIKTSDLKKFILKKDLSDYPVRHLLNALKAVEELDPDRLSHNSWRKHVLRGLADRAGKFARESVKWTVRAGEMSLGPTVALYEEAFQFFEAATGAMKRLSPRWHRTKLKEVKAQLMVRGAGEKALEMLQNIQPNQHEVAPAKRVGWWGFSPRPYRDAQIPDLSKAGNDGQLKGGENARFVEEETGSVLELNGKGAFVTLPVRPVAVIDTDGDGSESVTLDGSASNDADGTISSYRWTENGRKIATGANPGVNLSVGSHDITLTVTDDDGKTDSDTVNVTVEKPGLLHYNLDEGAGSTATDRSAHDHDGTLFGPTWSSSTPDGSSSCLTFDGSNDHVAISGLHYNSSRNSEVTVTTWVKTSDGSDQILASFDRSEYWRLEINGSGAGKGQVGWDVNTNSGQLDFGGNIRIDDGTWHHVAAVYDNGTTTLYIDGKKDASTSKGSAFGSGKTRFGFVGTGSEATSFNGNASPGNTLNGSVDDVRIYDTALSAARIQDLASTGSNSSPVANSDSVTTEKGTSVTFNALDNDSDPDGDTLSVSEVSSPSDGTASEHGNGKITYTPSADFQGSDRFEYTVSDGNGEQDTATVGVTVKEAINTGNNSTTGKSGAPTARAYLDQSAHSSFTLSFRVKLLEQPEGDAVLLRDESFTIRLVDGVPELEGQREGFADRAKEPLKPDRWYSIVLMRSAGKRIRLFVNGKKVVSQKIGNTNPYLYNLRLGEADIGMRLSDVRVYNGVLSRGKRLELMVDRRWFRTRAEALLSAGRAGEAEDMVEKWSEITERLVPPQPVRRSATIRRIESLVQRGSDQALLTAQELINDLLDKGPRRLLSGEFNITMLDMYLGRGANLVALNHAERLLNLQLASTHEEKIMARRVIALTRLGKLEKARNAFDKLKEEYPYGGSLRMAREELKKHEEKK